MEQSNLIEIDLNTIKNRSLLFSCPAFKLYEVVYEKSTVDIIPFYEFKPSFIDAETDYDIFANSENEADLSNLCLTKIGYFYEKKQNDLRFFYKKDDYAMFDLTQYLSRMEYKNIKLNKMQFFYDVLKIIEANHQNNNKISLFHPNLIFIKNDVKYLDNHYDDVVDCVDKIKYFQLSKYFGFIDMDVLDKIQNNMFSEEELRSIYFKTDIILITIFLAVLFSTTVTATKEENYGPTFDQILLETQNDFFKNNTNYKFLKAINDKDIIKFIAEINLFDFDGIPTIDEFISRYDILLKQEYAHARCFECSQSGSFVKKKVLYRCHDILCEKCENDHNCEYDTPAGSVSDVAWDNYKYQIARLKDISKKIPLMEYKPISKYFNQNLKAVLNEINDEQMKIEQVIQREEDIINNLIILIEEILNNRNDRESLEVEHAMINFKLYLENRPNIAIISKMASTTNLDLAMVDELSNIDSVLNRYNMFISESEKFKEVINNEVKLINTLNSATKQAIIFKERLMMNYQDNFIQALKDCSDKINNMLTQNHLIPSLKFTAQLHKMNENSDIDYIASLEPSTDHFYYFNIKEPEEPLYTKLEFWDKKIGKCFDDCRWINLGEKLFVCGGTGIKNYSLIPVHIVYTVNIIQINPELKIDTLKSMIHSRDQHMILKIDEINIFVMGGYATNTCELYNFLTDTWELKQSLNVCRYNSTVYFHNSKDIYLCFGFEGVLDALRNVDDAIKTTPLTSVERLRFFEKGAGWELISIDTTYHIGLSGVIPHVEQNKIFLLGGKLAEGGLSDKTYVLDFDTFNLTCEKNRLLKTKIAFIESTFYGVAGGWGQFDSNLSFTLIKNFI